MTHAEQMIVVYTTFPTEQDARTLGRALVSKKLCACVNIYPQIASIYRWQDAVEEAQETVMLVKTRTGLKEEVLTFLRENHPYTVPALFILQPTEVAAPYLQWLLSQASN